MFGSPRCSVAFPRLPVLLWIVLLTAFVSTPLMPKVASASLAHRAPESQDGVPLEPGKSIERELKGGEVHRYAVTLTAGQYLRVEVEQLGIDAVVAFLAPNKEMLLEFSANEAQMGKETACLVAERPGTYYFQVRAYVEEAKPARYAVRITELREATARDLNRFAVQRNYVEAYQLVESQALDSFRKAVPKFETALSLAQKIGDHELEAGMLFGLGNDYRAAHDQPKAIEYFERALRLSQTLGKPLDQARTLFKLSFCHSEIGQNPQARECLQRALPLYREVGDKGGEGRALWMMAESYARESPSRSLDYYQQAEPLLRVMGDTGFLIDTLYSMGLSWLQVGEPQKAFEVLFQALPLAERHRIIDSKANTLDNLSKVHQAVGEYQKALDTQYEALALRQSKGDVEAAANSYRYLGSIYLDLGETQRAVEFLQQSVKMRQSIGYHFRALMSQSELGKAWYLLGQHQTARDYFLSILPLARQYNDKFSEARTLEGLGLTFQALGDYKKALEFYEQALAVDRTIPWRAGEVQVILASGHAYASSNDFAKATEMYHQALSLARKLNYPHVEAAALSSIARAELKFGQLAEARANLDASLQIAESVRSSVASPALRASFLATQHSSYEAYVALLMQLHQQQPDAGYAANALQISERARSLTEILAEAPANIRVGVDAALLNRETELRQKLSAKSAAQNRAASQTEEQAAIFSREITEVTAELEQVEAQIRAASPRYAALTKPQTLSLPEIQQSVVGADTLLLEYALGEEQSFLFAITGKTFNCYELPKREVIETAARRYYELLTARNRTVKFEEPAQRAARIKRADKDLTTAGVELSRMILKPAAAELGERRLLIVADGALQLIPFAALPVPARSKEGAGKTLAAGRLLLDDHLISYLPSATALAQLRRDLKDRQPAPNLLAVFADPVFESDDERLPKDVRDQFARQRQPTGPAKDKPASPSLAADQLTRAIRDAGAEDERGGLARLRYTREEAGALLALAPKAACLSALDFDATQQAALNPALRQYRYVHFATHGLIDNLHPELSGLVLSRFDRQGRALDGHLRLIEISSLNLPAELVTLSACKSGLGKEVRGEGLLSLTRGFMHAGAARVLVSLWDVNDKSTAALMADFYRGLLQQQRGPSEALRAAQLRTRRSPAWSSPYFWAAFAQHGEPR